MSINEAVVGTGLMEAVVGIGVVEAIVGIGVLCGVGMRINEREQEQWTRWWEQD